MTKHRKPNPYKGVPKTEWATVREQEARRKAAEKLNEGMIVPNAFVAETAIATEIPPEIAAAMTELPAPTEVPRGTMPQPIDADAVPGVNSDSPTAQAIPRNLFDGQMKSLDVFGKNGSTTDPIPGYRLYWFTDTGNTGVRINQARVSGWELVNKDEIALQENVVPGNNDLGTHVRKVVDARTSPPQYGYLMKKPVWLDDLHRKQLAQENENIVNSVRSGRHSSDHAEGRYTASQVAGSTLPKIEISSKAFNRS
jgi:hypothetical protein